MKSFRDIITAFGGPVPFSEALAIPDTHARTMQVRDSIPPERWPELMRAASERGVKGITLEKLAELRAARFGRAEVA